MAYTYAKKYEKLNFSHLQCEKKWVFESPLVGLSLFSQIIGGQGGKQIRQIRQISNLNRNYIVVISVRPNWFDHHIGCISIIINRG